MNEELTRSELYDLAVLADDYADRCDDDFEIVERYSAIRDKLLAKAGFSSGPTTLFGTRKGDDMKTSDLTGAALDWSVAQAIGKPCHLYRINHRDRQPAIYSLRDDDGLMPAYSTDWAKGGPIIERERVHVYPIDANTWEADTLDYTQFGPTPLIAAMRCYVASKIGDNIDIPEELT